MFFESKNFLNKNQKNYINNVVLGDNFPFYWYDHQTEKDKKPFLSHVLYKRPEISNNQNQINSEHFGIFLDFLKSFLNKNKIELNKLFRASVNCTFNINEKKSNTHIDHEFDHKQVIIYLNDSEGETVILNDKNKIIKKIKPEKFKGICFDKKPHYIIYPKKGRRVIAVYTFI